MARQFTEAFIQVSYRKQNYRFFFYTKMTKGFVYKSPYGNGFFYKTGNGFSDLFNSAVRGFLNNKTHVAKNTVDFASKANKIIKDSETNRETLPVSRDEKQTQPNKKIDPEIVDSIVSPRKGKGIYDIN